MSALVYLKNNALLEQICVDKTPFPSCLSVGALHESFCFIVFCLDFLVSVHLYLLINFTELCQKS